MMNGEGSGEGHAVEPLGVFGVLAGQQEFERLRHELRALAGALPEEDRASVVRYLRAGKIVFAIMEHTRDVLDGAFGVPGGSALLTDGAYYWRYDAADYVDRYGIGLPEEFLRHGRALGWVPQAMTEEDFLDMYDYLKEHVHRVPPDE